MKNISEAFVSFQSELKPIDFDSENPFFKSNYLSLSGILENIIPLLTKNKLSISQPMRVENGIVIISTVIRHTSGETIQSDMILPPISDVQKFGSLITYYKRYQLQAMLGISAKNEDDDGNGASGKHDQPKSSTYQPNNGQSVIPKNDFPASEAQKGAMRKMGIQFKETISKQDASKMIEAFNKGK